MERRNQLIIFEGFGVWNMFTFQMIGEQNLKKKKVSSILFGVNGESKGYGMFDLV